MKSGRILIKRALSRKNTTYLLFIIELIISEVIITNPFALLKVIFWKISVAHALPIYTSLLLEN
jgi:hypothetical protein